MINETDQMILSLVIAVGLIVFVLLIVSGY